MSVKTEKSKKEPPRNLGGKLLRIGIVVLVIGGAVAMAVDIAQPELPPPSELEAVQTFPDMGADHLAPGEADAVYNSDPPTSGPHSPTPAPCGIYRQPVPDVSSLHSMEHGAIVVQYDPGLPQAQIEELEEIGHSVGGEIIVAPRPGNPAAVALTAWTNLLLLDRVDEAVISGFERGFGNRSPEPAALCPFQVDEAS